MSIAPRKGLGAQGLAAAFVLAALAGCLNWSSALTTEWTASSARYEDDSGALFSLELGPARTILTHDNRWRMAIPLTVNVAEGDPMGEATVWLGSDFEVVRKDLPCTRLEQGACAAANVDFDEIGDAPPHAVGLLGREVLRSHGKTMPVARTGTLVEVGPYVVPEAGWSRVLVRAQFDASPFPAWVQYVDDVGQIVKTVRRTSLTADEPLAAADPLPLARLHDALSGFRVFPGENDDVLRRGFPLIEPFDALMQQSSRAREMYDVGCLVKINVRESPGQSDRSQDLGVSARASDFAFVHAAVPGDASTRWLLSKQKDLLGNEAWRIDRVDEMRPVACERHNADHWFAVDAPTAMERFDELSLTYQSSPQFSLTYRDVDTLTNSPSQLWFEITAIPSYVNLSSGLAEWQPHTVRLDVETGDFKLIQYDPVDSWKFTRPE